MDKTALVVGAGLGGLSTALRLQHLGYSVTVLEMNDQAGGRLNQLQKDGFTWDLGPTFFSMTYEFHDFLKDIGIENGFQFTELEPLYQVNFSDSQKWYRVSKDLNRLAAEFSAVEPDIDKKMEKLLAKTGKLFHDTENKIVRKNIDTSLQYLYNILRVPPRHIPLLFRSFWKENSRYFNSREAREIFSLVAFFLGGTPFTTSAVFTLLTYVEMKHNGYHNVAGGMYQIVKFLLDKFKERNIKIRYNTRITGYRDNGNNRLSLTDNSGKEWKADVIVINADAALFRSRILQREAYNENRLAKLNWTMAPFTIYLGIDKKLDKLEQHNYFLGRDFRDYASNIFSSNADLSKPYYYVNVPSKNNPESAPQNCEALYILCPVPHLQHKNQWDDSEEFASSIISDLGQRIGVELEKHIISKTVMTPLDWRDKFDLYQGSGLGLAHNLTQMAALRPKNRDEKFRNLYYVGASTVPGTGLPMVIISSKLVTEQILKDHGPVS